MCMQITIHCDMSYDCIVISLRIAHACVQQIFHPIDSDTAISIIVSSNTVHEKGFATLQAWGFANHTRSTYYSASKKTTH